MNRTSFNGKMKQNAQTISMDALIAIALFIIVITLFFSLSTDTSNENKIKHLQSENTKLMLSVSGSKNGTAPVLSGSKISESKLAQLANLSYMQLKDSLGVQADFCIYFEDEDGNIINVTGSKTGLGSSNIRVGGVACG